MSSLQVHLIQGAVSTAALYPFLGPKALIFGASVVLIDLDHLVESHYITGEPGPKAMFRLRDLAHKHFSETLGMNLLHTFEAYVLIYLLGTLVSPLFFYVLAGFLFHHLFDQIYLTSKGHPFVRALSLIEYFIRKKNYLTIKQLVEKYGLPD